MAGDDDWYEGALAEIKHCRRLIDALAEVPRTADSKAALDQLGKNLTQAIQRLGQLDPTKTTLS